MGVLNTIRGCPRCGIVIAVVLVALAAPSAAAATDNLLQDPGAEAASNGVLPGWSTSGGFGAAPYGSGSGPSAAAGQAIGGGREYFFGGFTPDLSFAVQTIDVSADASAIDAGGASVLIGGFLGGANGSSMTMTADALDQHGTATARISLQGRSDGGLEPFAARTTIPAGTRSLRVTLEGVPGNTAYADNLVVMVGNPSPATIAALPPALAARLLGLLPTASAAGLLISLQPGAALAILAAAPQQGVAILDALSATAPSAAFRMLASIPAAGAVLLSRLPTKTAVRILRTQPTDSSTVASLLDYRFAVRLTARLLSTAATSAGAELLARITPRVALGDLTATHCCARRITRALAWLAPAHAVAVVATDGRGWRLFAKLGLDDGMHLLLAGGARVISKLLYDLHGAAAASYRLRLRILQIARSQLGVGETPGTKCNPYGPCEEWCADFATWVWDRAGVGIGRIAWVPNLEAWGMQHGTWKPGASNNPEPGDFIIYTWQHVGIVEQVSPSGLITVISGNQYPDFTVRRNGPVRATDWRRLSVSPVTGYVSPPGASAVAARVARTTLPIPTPADIAAQDHPPSPSGR